ncbi:hypothetical protein [Sphingomonas sp. Leaf242]|uniref:hypothetical protein n=1 Tax=Sphingomonas sp. Leaf242 TaxID=1736304 RepID=UPI0012E1037E|nr:hypothetical protein [Sphingomonas sp. Leaf242]
MDYQTTSSKNMDIESSVDTGRGDQRFRRTGMNDETQLAMYDDTDCVFASILWW